MARKLEVVIVGDTSGLERSLGRAGKAGTSFGQKVQRGAKIAGLALAGGLAVAAKVGWDEMAQGQKVAAQTEAVLKSTGRVANVTARDVENLGRSLMMKSGVDDEAIKSGENLLLTFRGIRNEAGRGNDIFNQATKATLDLSVAMGKDMSDSAILVGKALQDPIRGLSAMRRVGIQFTTAQEAQIKALVESGNVMGAQKLILRELNKEFGGSAEAAGKTLPGQLNIAKESFRNMAGELMTSLIPAITMVAQNLTVLAGFLQKHPALAKAMVIGLAALAAALLAASVASTLLNLSLLANPVGLVVIGIIALAAAIVVAYRRFETFRMVANAVMNFVRDHWRLLVVVITGGMGAAVLMIVRHWATIRATVTAAVNFIREHWRAMAAYLTVGLSEAVPVIVRHWGTIRSTATAAFNAVRAVAVPAFHAIAAATDAVVGGVRTIVGWVNSAISAISRLSSAIRSIPTPSLPSLPHIPGFASGGVVPGLPGSPQLIMAHGGETVLPTHRRSLGRSGGGVVVNINGPVFGADAAQLANGIRRALLDKGRGQSVSSVLPTGRLGLA